MGQNWEEIADEVASSEAPPRGLATGTRRGPSIAYPTSETDASGTGYLAAPEIPRCIAPPRHRLNATRDEVLGGHLEKNGCGEWYHIARAPFGFDADYQTLPQRLNAVLRAQRFAALSGAQLSDLVFMDIETTGLSSSEPLFLIGALWFEGAETARLDSFLALDLEQEAAILSAYHKLAGGKTLVTFNGKSFDWPFIENRSLRHRVPFSSPRAHLDLLLLARRMWRSQTPNCKLQTLETHICGRARIDDIASSRIPATYHRYLERQSLDQSTLGRAAAMLSPIVHHNALDVLTMAELLCFAGEKRTWQDVSRGDR